MTLQYLQDEDSGEFEAELLVDGHPDVLDVFLRLTGPIELHLRTDPRGDNLRWDSWNVPSDADITTDAALRPLMDLDYVAEVVRLGKSDYLVRASQRAKEVRSIYDRLPERAEPAAHESRPATP